MSKKARCSFCGSTENEVSKLFSGIDGALICDRCIESCFDILELSNEKMGEKLPEDISTDSLLTPKEIKEKLDENFPNIMNVKFTAELENQLDEVAEGEKDWVNLLSVFYKELKHYIDKFKITVEEEMSRTIESDVPCPCGKGNMILKTGRFGRYLACPNESDDCKEKISLKGVEIPAEDIKNGKIFVKEKVEEIVKANFDIKANAKYLQEFYLNKC